MLKKFEVKNYKIFKDSITIDFSKTNGYKYNEDCISNDLISKMIIYGKNATGKTNLGIALLDIIFNLGNPNTQQFDAYLNANSNDKYADFKYTFVFGKDELLYEYGKTNIFDMCYEKLTLNGQECFYCNFETAELRTDNLNLLKLNNINTTMFLDSIRNSANKNKFTQLTFIRWLVNNVAIANDSALLKFYMYVISITILGKDTTQHTTLSHEDFLNFLSQNNNLEDFKNFLNEMGVQSELQLAKLPDDTLELYFKNIKLIPFFKNASSGTLVLTELYRKLTMSKNLSLIYIDEFDAFYHYELSTKIIKFLKDNFKDCQVILTTHNTNLMSNRLMRPDCLFILSQQGQLTSLSDATPRELREGHNLEKMYIAGEFDKYE